MAYIASHSQPLGFLAAIGIKLKSALRHMQYARMVGCLSNMSQAQLTHIGITRADIPQYAEKLMAE